MLTSDARSIIKQLVDAVLEADLDELSRKTLRSYTTKAKKWLSPRTSGDVWTPSYVRRIGNRDRGITRATRKSWTAREAEQFPVDLPAECRSIIKQLVDAVIQQEDDDDKDRKRRELARDKELKRTRYDPTVNDPDYKKLKRDTAWLKKQRK
jgi:hypothetical protein